MLTATNVISKVLSLLYVPFLIGAISDEGYGIYYAAYNVYVFVYMLTISGTSSVIPKLVAQYSARDEEDDAMASFKIGKSLLVCLGLFMMLSLFISSKTLAEFIGYKKAYLALIVLCPSILITAINSSYRGYFQGRNNMAPIAISQLTEQIGNTVFTIICSYFLMNIGLEYGVAGGAIGTTIGASFSLITLLISYRKEKKPLHSKPRSTTNKYLATYMFKYSMPLLISTGLIYAANNLIDVSNIKQGLLKAGFSDSLATIRYGNFGNYNQLMNIPMVMISSLALTALPLIARTNSVRDNEKLKSHIKQIFRICFLISIPSAVGLAVLSEPIFDMIFITAQSKGSDIMLYGSFIIIFHSVLQLSITILNSVGRIYKATISAVLGAIIKIAANFILIPISFINIYGAIIGLFLSQCIPFFLNHRYIKNHIGTTESLINSWKKPLISSIIMGIVVFFSYRVSNYIFSIILIPYLSNIISVFLCIYIGALVYIHCLVKIDGVTDNDLNVIPNKFRKFVFL